MCSSDLSFPDLFLSQWRSSLCLLLSALSVDFSEWMLKRCLIPQRPTGILDTLRTTHDRLSDVCISVNVFVCVYLCVCICVCVCVCICVSVCVCICGVMSCKPAVLHSIAPCLGCCCGSVLSGESFETLLPQVVWNLMNMHAPPGPAGHPSPPFIFV